MKETLSSVLADYLLELKNKPLQPDIREKALAFFADTIGCMVSGSQETAVEILGEYASRYSGPVTSSVLGTKGQKADAEHAALVNGAAAHFHDFDDVSTTMVGHPSVAVLPAALALGEELDASGEEVISAYTAGIEVAAMLGRLLVPEHNQKGWHSTQTIGIFGATAAAAYLMDLNKEQIMNAFGIAASESSGLEANYGTMTKPLHAGRAASKGIFAARLAQMGVTSSPSALDAKTTGFITATTGAAHEDAFFEAIENNNSEFLNPGLTMKPWPCCKGMHNAIWAMMEAMRKYHLKAEDIDHVDCRTLPFAKDILLYEIAKTPTEGKFSMNYCISLVILHGRLVMSDFYGDKVEDKELIDMMHRVKLVIDEDLVPGAGYYDPKECEQVDVYLKDGRVIKERCDCAKGTPGNPMNLEERRAKIRDCFSKAMDEEEAEKTLNILERVDHLATIRELTGTLVNAYRKG